MFHIDITYSFPIPKPTVDLLQSVRLKWQAERLGFEKLVIKKSKMLAYFVSNPDSPYYQSEIFGRILQKSPANRLLPIQRKENAKYPTAVFGL